MNKQIETAENKFFEELATSLKTQGVNAFYQDGIVDEDAYEESKIKILFLLKEPVGKPNKPFQLSRDFLREGAKHTGDQTWRNVTRWIYAIHNNVSHDDWKRYLKEVDPKGNSRKERLKWLKYIIAINLKKQAGASRSNTKKLKQEFHDKYESFLPEQLSLYPNVDLIVCCGDGVWDCLKPNYEKAYGIPMTTTDTLPSKTHPKKYKYFISKDTPCVINFWHPSAIQNSWYKCSRFIALVNEVMQQRGSTF